LARRRRREPPDCLSQNVIFWVALAFVAAIIAAMFFTGAK